jgi:hypothetical protein
MSPQRLGSKPPAAQAPREAASAILAADGARGFSGDDFLMGPFDGTVASAAREIIAAVRDQFKPIDDMIASLERIAALKFSDAGVEKRLAQDLGNLAVTMRRRPVFNPAAGQMILKAISQIEAVMRAKADTF